MGAMKLEREILPLEPSPSARTSVSPSKQWRLPNKEMQLTPIEGCRPAGAEKLAQEGIHL